MPPSPNKNMIKDLKQIPKEKYQDLVLADLGAYTLALLEKMNQELTIENICVALSKMFPEKFSMVGYPEYPDGMRGNRTLMQMQPKYKNYATGSATKGYRLTQYGRNAAEGLENVFIDEKATSAAGTPSYKKRRPQKEAKRTITPADEIQRVRESEIFKLFQTGSLDKARGMDFLEIINAFTETPPLELRKRLSGIKDAAENVSDKEVLSFLSECKNKFGKMLRD